MTIVSGTFLLHTTKDVVLPLDAFLQLIIRGGGAASAGSAASGSRVNLLAAGGEGNGDDGVELGTAGTPKGALRRGAAGR